MKLIDFLFIIENVKSIMIRDAQGCYICGVLENKVQDYDKFMNYCTAKITNIKPFTMSDGNVGIDIITDVERNF